MTDQNFKLSVTNYDKTFTIELNHSDVSASELYDIFRAVALALGYHPETVDEILPVE